MEKTAERSEKAGNPDANDKAHPGETAGMGEAQIPHPGTVMQGAPWYYGPQPGAWPHTAQAPSQDAWYWYRQGMAAAYAQAPGFAFQPHPARAHHPKHDEHRYGQMMDMLGRFLNGEVQMGDLVNGFSGLDFQNDQFWKGVIVGTAITLLLTNQTIQKGLAGTVGAIFGAAKGRAEKASGASTEATGAEAMEKTEK